MPGTVLPAMRLLTALLFAVALQAQPSYDVILSGGRVIDGTGSAWYHLNYARFSRSGSRRFGFWPLV